MRMKLLGILLFAWALAGAGYAQIYKSAPGAVTAGGTAVTCTSGTTGVLFQSSGAIACNANFTTDGSGNVGLAGSTTIGWATNAQQILGGGVGGNLVFVENAAANMIFDNPGGESMFWRGAGGVTRLDWNNATALTWTFPSTAAVTMASATVKLTGVTTGTNADTLCLSATGVVLIQAAACTISSARFKENFWPIDNHYALSIVDRLNPIEFNMRPDDRPNPDINFARPQIGLTAENVAAVDPRMAIYEDDGVTPKSYRQEAVIAALVGAVRDLKSEFEAYRRNHP